MDLLLQGIMLGLAAAPYCSMRCLPLAAPLLLRAAGGTAPWHGAFAALVQFLAGRLLGYLGVGLLLAFAGKLFAQEHVALIAPLLYAVAALALLLSLRAPAASCRPRATISQFLLGLTTGLDLCLPFIAVVARVLALPDGLARVAFFAAFFLGTSLWLLPLPLIAPLLRTRVLPPLARASGIAVAAWLLCDAMRLLPAPAPAIAPIAPVAPATAPLAAVTLNTAELAPEVRGFAGPVPLRITVAPDGIIRAARFLPNRETPAWFAKLVERQYDAHFVGRSVFDPLVPGVDLAAVTGATISATAAADGVRLAGRRALAAAAAAPAPMVPAPTAARHLTPQFLLQVALILAALFLWWRPRPSLRPWLLAVVVLVSGFLLRDYLSLAHLPSLWHGLATPTQLLLATVALGGTPMLGRFFCGWLCPFGALSELLGRLRPTRACTPPPRHRPAPFRLSKAAALAITLLLFAAGAGEPFILEPFTPLFTCGATPFLALLIVLLLAMSVFIPRYFCRYLCPLGGLLAMLACFATDRWQLPRSATHCGRCAESCPTGALYADADGQIQRDAVECIECRLCLGHCPQRDGTA